nr:hypothetical protein GCM10020185_25000 [Pseudomonas brassicacearum subsp. brassicacearum]
MLATGYQQGAKVEVLHQLRAFAHQFVLIGTTTNDGFEFTEIRRDQAGTTVDGEILALGIGQDRNATGTSGLDQRLVVFFNAPLP